MRGFRVGIGEPIKKGDSFVLSIGVDNRVLYFPVDVAEQITKEMFALVVQLKEINERVTTGTATIEEVGKELEAKYGMKFENDPSDTTYIQNIQGKVQ